jgi:hypothetical protein
MLKGKCPLGEVLLSDSERLYRLERDGHFAGEAKRLLATSEKLQKMLMADRDRLLRKLASAKASRE